jgi:hypothetical protein
MDTQGRGSKQRPVLLSPAPIRPWQGPGWPFQKASGCKGAVLVRGRPWRGAPLARKFHKEKNTHSDHGHEISLVVSAPFVCGWQFESPVWLIFFVAPLSMVGGSSNPGMAIFFCGAPPGVLA